MHFLSGIFWKSKVTLKQTWVWNSWALKHWKFLYIGKQKTLYGCSKTLKISLFIRLFMASKCVGPNKLQIWDFLFGYSLTTREAAMLSNPEGCHFYRTERYDFEKGLDGNYWKLIFEYLSQWIRNWCRGANMDDSSQWLNSLQFQLNGLWRNHSMKSSIVKHKYFKRMYVSILILAPPETFSDFLSAHAMAERTHVPRCSLLLS